MSNSQRIALVAALCVFRLGLSILKVKLVPNEIVCEEVDAVLSFVVRNLLFVSAA